MEARSSLCLRALAAVSTTAIALATASEEATEISDELPSSDNLDLTIHWDNNSLNGTTVRALYSDRRKLIFGGILMSFGVIGNFLALVILARKKATKNSKYTYMLRCLATNNLIALVGMVGTLLLECYLPKEVAQKYIRWNCGSKVVWRFFGLNSGCIAAVMAIERWMALARPFIYHKHITYELIQKTIKSFFFIAVAITFLPFFGFGAYIDESDPLHPKCLRYRDAGGFWNKTYAILFMLFGTILCVVIVACNLFVTRVLCFIGRTRTTKRHMHYDLVNREKGSTTSHRIDSDSNSGSSQCGQPQYFHSNSVTTNDAASPDEIKFAKLMTFLSISFVICWMPQMIAIPMAISPNRVRKDHLFFIIADVLMAFHFTSDPYVYVLSRTKQSYIFGCVKSLRGGLRRTQSKQSRLRTVIAENTLDCPFH